MTIKHPEVEVQLTGEDGNAFFIIGRAGVSAEEIAQFHDEATSGDYDTVLQTCMKWVDVS